MPRKSKSLLVHREDSASRIKFQNEVVREPHFMVSADSCPSERSTHGESPRRCTSLVILSLLTISCAFPNHAWGRKVNLTRKYRAGQTMVYQTKIETHAKIRANPRSLEAFLPPLPTEMTTRQQATVTVLAIHADGSVDVENRFDQFALHSNLLERVPENVRDSTRQAQ